MADCRFRSLGLLYISIDVIISIPEIYFVEVSCENFASFNVQLLPFKVDRVDFFDREMEFVSENKIFGGFELLE